MRCDAFREQLQPYLDEALEGADREAWRGHLQGCAECRRWAVAADPTLLFAAVEPAEADQRQVDACADRVAALIRQERLEERLRPRRRPWLAAAAAVLMAVGVGVVWQMVPDGQQPLAADNPAVVPAVQAADDEVEPPKVEVDMAGEGVRVYQYADGEDDDTAVVFIVNPALES